MKINKICYNMLICVEKNIIFGWKYNINFFNFIILKVICINLKEKEKLMVNI